MIIVENGWSVHLYVKLLQLCEWSVWVNQKMDHERKKEAQSSTTMHEKSERWFMPNKNSRSSNAFRKKSNKCTFFSEKGEVVI